MKIVPVRETRKITGFDCVHYKKRESPVHINPVHINDAPNFGMHTCFFLSLKALHVTKPVIFTHYHRPDMIKIPLDRTYNALSS